MGRWVYNDASGVTRGVVRLRIMGIELAMSGGCMYGGSIALSEYV